MTDEELRLFIVQNLLNSKDVNLINHEKLIKLADKYYEYIKYGKVIEKGA